MAKSNDKERILKAARERKAVTDKGNPTRLSVDSSAETLQNRREQHDILKILKGKKSAAQDILFSRAFTVSYTHLTLPTKSLSCRSRWSPYH